MNLRKYPCYITEDQFVSFWEEYFNKHPSTLEEYISLYIHYPWCKSICKFCVFGQLKYNEYVGDIKEYENHTIMMIDKINDVFNKKNIVPSELYFGGGTASLWTKESMLKIKNSISMYDHIKLKQMEIHHSDLNDNNIEFYINDMNFDRISIGVQSFDRTSNLEQNRIPPEIEKIRNAIKVFQSNEIKVNIDLLAMLNGDKQENWSIFEEDLYIAMNDIKPNTIFVSPNFKSNDFYGISIHFREILKTFLCKYPHYKINNEYALSLNYEDIISYRDNPYILSLDDKIDNDPEYEVTIGIGGIDNFTACSKTTENDFINMKYIPNKMEFISVLTKHTENNDYLSNGYSNHSLQVGSYKIPTPKNI